MNFSDFIGNSDAVEKLHLVATDAVNTGGKLPHLGFFGPPGCGKTSMASIVASYVDRPFVYVSSTAIKDANFLCDLLMRHRGGAVILLDECHRLPGVVQDNMLSVLEEPAKLVSTWKGRIMYTDLPPGLSFILATTHEGNIRDALLSRLIKIEFHEYNIDDHSIIARNCLRDYHRLDIDEEALALIGARSRSPREVIQNCNLMAMKARDMRTSIVGVEVVEEVFRILAVDRNGLTKRDRQILEYLTMFSFAGLKTIAAYINMPEEDVAEKIEPWLLRNKFIVRLPRGRKITPLGIRALEGEFIL